MFKKILSILPLCALLVACGGNNNPKQDANNGNDVDQKLPDDVTEIITPDPNGESDPAVTEEYRTYFTKFLNGLFDFSSSKEFFHIDIDADVNFSIPDIVDVDAVLKGGLSLYIEDKDNDLHNLYLSIEGLTIQGSIKYQLMEQEQLLEVNYEDLDLALYLVELEETTYAYLDVSDIELRALLQYAFDTFKSSYLSQLEGEMDDESSSMMYTIISGMDFNSLWTLLFGYDNSGKGFVDIADAADFFEEVFESIMEDSAEEIIVSNEQLRVIYEESYGMFDHLFKQWVTSYIQQYGIYLFMGIGMLNGVAGSSLGAKKDDQGVINKISYIINNNAYAICEALGLEGEVLSELEYLKGINFGLSLSVGNNNGSENLTFEELSLIAECKNLNVAGMTFNGKFALDITAHYNDGVEFSFPENFDEYFDMLSNLKTLYEFYQYMNQK